ncbi:MAG: beta-lactamase family protein [Lachnospiraceae bacterium]|nr:beta-lactamase family protein [Lachnospiraceae bacterium]
MKRIKQVIILILTVPVFMSSSVFANAMDTDGLISDRIEEFRDNTKCGAVSVAVVRGDKTEVYGDAEGLYLIGSMTKAFTGLAVQKLIADGMISEDDPISDILPGFTAYYESKPCDITIGQLLTQTSGYTNSETDYPGASEDMSLAEWVDDISGKELHYRPGNRYAYSNVNYNLLGAVIGQVSGQSYEEYMKTKILAPLGLTNTYVQVRDGEESIISGSRPGYRHAFEYDIPVSPGRIPAGYFYSNAADMTRWIRIWIGTADIPEEYKVLLSVVKGSLHDPGDYYSGWEAFENGTTGHSGGTPDYSSRIVFSDREQTGVCVLANMNVAASTDSLCNGIYAACTGGGFGSLKTDVWTVFDIIFTAVTVSGILLILLSVFARKRGVPIFTGCFQIVITASVCAVMPPVFGAGLKDIMLIWAPYSFAGGIIVLTAGIPVSAIRLWMIVKNESRKKRSEGAASDCHHRVSSVE